VELLIARSGGLGAMRATLVGLDTTAYRLGGNAGSDFNVGLLDADPSLNGRAAGSSVFGSEKPLSIGFGQSCDGDDANTRFVVTAISRSETDTPASLESRKWLVLFLHFLQNAIRFVGAHLHEEPNLLTYIHPYYSWPRSHIRELAS